MIQDAFNYQEKTNLNFNIVNRDLIEELNFNFNSYFMERKIIFYSVIIKLILIDFIIIKFAVFVLIIVIVVPSSTSL
jgi:large-conductance mechanosensitive channel